MLQTIGNKIFLLLVFFVFISCSLTNANEEIETKKLKELRDKYPNAEILIIKGTYVISFRLEKKNISDWYDDIKDIKDSVSYLNFNYHPEFKTLVDSIQNFKNIDYLEASFTELKEIPQSFFKLKKLEYLILESNKINSIPHNINQLKRLQRLYLDHNQIDEIPNSICKMISLKELTITDNLIKTIPNRNNFV